MQAILFIDLIAFNLNHLNTIVEKDISDWNWANVFVVENVKKADMIGKRLSKYRFIHFLLWKKVRNCEQNFWLDAANNAITFVRRICAYRYMAIQSLGRYLECNKTDSYVAWF